MGEIASGRIDRPAPGPSRPGIVPPWLGDDISILPVPAPAAGPESPLAQVLEAIAPLLDAATGAAA